MSKLVKLRDSKPRKLGSAIPPQVMKHTPGPWRYGLSDQGSFHMSFHIDAENNTAIGFARVYRHETDKKKQARAEADAILIAAAPELLAALKDAVENCSCSPKQRMSGHLTSCHCEVWQEVIAKAEGNPES